MIARIAGMREANGQVQETIIDEETGVASFVQWDEVSVRNDLVGNE